MDIGMKIDLDALERALIGSAMGLTFRECQTLIKYARALESRASNAGGAVAWSVTNDGGKSISSVLFENYYDAADHARRCGGTTKPIRVYTHPAPASKEPVADERAAEYRNEWNPLLECYERVRVHDVQQLIAEDDRAALATAQPPEGWRLVPSKPTPEMIEAGNAVFSDGWTYALPVYANMLAAAPAKPEGGNV